VVAAREFDFWTSGEAASLSGPVEATAAGARRVFKAIEARTTRIRPGEEVAPGLVAIDTAGHTGPHLTHADVGPNKLFITADALQNAHIAFARPDWQSRVDMDGAKLPRTAGNFSIWRQLASCRYFATTFPFRDLAGSNERARPSRGWLTFENGAESSAAQRTSVALWGSG
jgi:hypothetical protein